MLKGPRIVNIMRVPVLEAMVALLLVCLARSQTSNLQSWKREKGKIRGSSAPIAKVSFKRLPNTEEVTKAQVSCKKLDFQLAHISTNNKNA